MFKKNKNNMNTTSQPEADNKAKDNATQTEAATEQQQAERQQQEQPLEENNNDQPTDEQLNEHIAELEQKCADLADKNLRMLAEFNNYRQRTSKEKLELTKTAGEKIFCDMLPLVDDFERAKAAMAQTDDIEAVRQGINLIYDKFLAFLKKYEVEPIDTTDSDFDTEFHEAITTIPSTTPEQKGKVIDCTQRGYTLAGKVIRYAKVVVGN